MRKKTQTQRIGQGHSTDCAARGTLDHIQSLFFFIPQLCRLSARGKAQTVQAEAPLHRLLWGLKNTICDAVSGHIIFASIEHMYISGYWAHSVVARSVAVCAVVGSMRSL